MSDNSLEGVAILQLAKMHLLHLQSLALSDNRLDAAAVKQLTKVNWPQLGCLDLSGTACINNTAADLGVLAVFASFISSAY